MRAAIYARKSDEQTGVADEHRSVARQIEHAREYAASKGWTVVDECIFQDDGVSGAEFAKRPGFIRLMNALSPPHFDVLVMSEGSRLGRESIETAYALKQLVSAGVRVFSYLDDCERTLQGPTDKLLMSVASFADELERERVRQRTHDALSRKAKAGHVTGGRVFGYDNIPITDAQGHRTHVERRINEAEAVVVRRIFELAGAGIGIRRIALALNEDLRREQQDCARRIERLVTAIAEGADAPTALLAKLRELEARQKALDTEIRWLRPVPRLAGTGGGGPAGRVAAIVAAVRYARPRCVTAGAARPHRVHASGRRL